MPLTPDDQSKDGDAAAAALYDFTLPGRVRSISSGTSAASQCASESAGEHSILRCKYFVLHSPSSDSCKVRSSSKLVTSGGDGRGTPVEDGNDVVPAESPSCVISMMAATVVDVQECGGAEVTLRTCVPAVSNDVDPTIVEEDDDCTQRSNNNLSIPPRQLSTELVRTKEPSSDFCQRQTQQQRQQQRESGPNANNGGGASKALSSLFCGVADIVSCREDTSASPQHARGAIVMDQCVGRFDTSTTPTKAIMEGARQKSEQQQQQVTPVKAGKEERPAAPPSPDPVSCIPTRACWKSDAEEADGGVAPDAGGCIGSSATTVVGDAVARKQRAVEVTIGGFLGSRTGTTWCDGWQAWSMHMEVGSDVASVMDPLDLKKVLRNRAGDLSSRRRRIWRLRRDLSPFDPIALDSGVTGPAGGDDGKPIPGVAPGVIRKAHSFTASPAPGSRYGSSPANTDVASSVVSMTSSVLETMQNCGEVNEPPPKLSAEIRAIVERGQKKHHSDDDELCYDSDPGEEARIGHGRHHQRDGVRGQASEDNQLSVDLFLRQGGTWGSDLDARDSRNDGADKAALDPANDVQMSRTIDDIIHRRMTLVWHRTPDGGSKDDSPVAVYAWIELGSQLRSALIQPKFMWKPVHETEDEYGSLGISNLRLHSVDLLDICRILLTDRIDRKRFPLAKRKCSLTIETFDHTLLFEARCEEERDRIVEGMKMLVARLASKIIVGDDRVFDEFFTPCGASVIPGEPPRWATLS